MGTVKTAKSQKTAFNEQLNIQTKDIHILYESYAKISDELYARS